MAINNSPNTAVTVIRFLIPAAAFCALLLLIRCANPVSPSGGPKDITPPEVLETQPANLSTQFKSKTIRIDYDEFVNVDQGPTKIIISPPFRNKPDFRLRGKSMVIAVKDTLLPNTTYIIQMMGAISDITENNVQAQYTYLFSTGDFVDSLRFSGNVTDAFTMKPVKDCSVMLYPLDMDTIPADSFPIRIKPWYLTRSNENGDFTFTGLSSKPFKIIALEDQSGDLLFNQISERIAFLDSLVTGYAPPPVVPDSLASDTAGIRESVADTLTPATPLPRAPTVLKLFKEDDTIQDILKDEIIREQIVRLIFKNPLRDYRIRIFDSLTETRPRYMELNDRRDTLLIWPEKQIGDTLTIGITDTGFPEDTLEFIMGKKDSPRKGKKGEAITPSTLDIVTNAKGAQLNHFKSSFVLSFGFPLKEYDYERIIINLDKDTIHPSYHFADTLFRKLVVDYPWQEGKFYRVMIPDSSFTSINGMSHDTVRTSFKTPAMRDLGSLVLDISLDQAPGSYIIQLLTDKEAVVEEQLIAAGQKTEFRYLQPGRYKVKAILDRNKNKKWDTGNYRQKLQPEEVIYFPRTIEIRANWDVEEPWAL